jgi:ribose transport system permease protein
MTRQIESEARGGSLTLLRRAQSAVGLILIFLLAALLSPCENGSKVFLGALVAGRPSLPIFLEVGNLTDTLRAVTVVGVMALAMTFVILTAGIDLSVGSILALSTCVLSKLLTVWNPPGMAFVPHIAIAVLAAIAACTLVGAVSGVVIARIGVPPFIVTLAAMIGIRGLGKWLTNNATLDIGFGQDAAALFAKVVSTKWVTITSYAVLAAGFAGLLGKTVFGRYVRAVGDNEKAAKYSGLPIASVKIWVYALSGLLAGVAGVLYAAQTNQGDPNAGMGYELDVIAAVVIGGTSLAGGRGSVVGTVIGTLIVGVLTNILGLRNVDSNVQMMIKAVIIILAVWLQKRDKAE